MELREYQTEAIEKIREKIRSTGQKRIILQAACGAGKTIIAAEIVKNALDKDSKVLFLHNRRDLVHQTVKKFEEYGIGDSVGVIMAGEDHMLRKPVQVVSIQTYIRRIKVDDEWLHDADLVIFDECHSSLAPTYQQVMDKYMERSVILGLTATPCRADGRGLGKIYDHIVLCIGILDLTEMGFLVPMVHFGPSAPDLKKIKITAGDYNKKELGEVMDKAQLIGDTYENWMRLAGDRQTVIFAVNVKHSKHFRDQFTARGISIEHIDAHTPDDERESTYARFECGDTQVLTNVGICTEGSDFPNVGCIVIARPTKSYGRYIQMAGRGLRPHPGKKDCILLDHSGCIKMHGFVDDEMYWTLNDREKAWKKPPKKKEKPSLTCDMCSHEFRGKRCPECGYEIKDYGKKIEAIEAELKEMGRTKKEKASMEDKALFYGMLEYYRREKGYQPGWVYHKFKEKFGVWPNSFKDCDPVEPNNKFRNYIKYLNIKWAKAKRKEDGPRDEVGPRKNPIYDNWGGLLSD